MYIGVLSPQRGFPSCSAHTSNTAEMPSATVAPGRSRARTSDGSTPQSRTVARRRRSSSNAAGSITPRWRAASWGMK